MQAQRLLPGLVEGYYLEHAVGVDRHKVRGKRLVGRIRNLPVENVALEVVVCRIGCFEAHIARRHAPRGLHIGVYLEVEAALELGALSGQLLRIKRYVLIARGTRGHRHKVGHPQRAAQRTAARAYAAYASGFLTGAYLLHLYAHLERFGKYLDKLPEIDAFVGYVVEYGFVSVALVFHVADFHVQLQAFGDFPRADHGVVLAGLGLVVFLYVGVFGFPEYPSGLGAFLGACAGFLHAQLNERTGERHHADVVPGLGFHRHHVADFQRYALAVEVVSFARVLELHLNIVAFGETSRNVGEVVEAVQLGALAVADRTCSRALACASVAAVSAVVVAVFAAFEVGHGLILRSLPNGFRG